MLEVTTLDIPDVRLIIPTRHRDDRGYFSEVYSHRAFAEIGISDTFVQDNHSLSSEPGTMRGLHFQIDPHPTAKLVRVTSGAIWDAAVDLRHGSPTFGQHVSAELSASNGAQIYVPVGFAHGFVTLEPATEVAYKVTDYWSVEVDKGVAWDDPDLNIPWPVDPKNVILSDKDRSQPRMSDLSAYFQMETS